MTAIAIVYVRFQEAGLTPDKTSHSIQGKGNKRKENAERREDRSE